MVLVPEALGLVLQRKREELPALVKDLLHKGSTDAMVHYVEEAAVKAGLANELNTGGHIVALQVDAG